MFLEKCNHVWIYTMDHIYECSKCMMCKGRDGKLFGPLYPKMTVKP